MGVFYNVPPVFLRCNSFLFNNETERYDLKGGVCVMLILSVVEYLTSVTIRANINSGSSTISEAFPIPGHPLCGGLLEDSPTASCASLLFAISLLTMNNRPEKNITTPYDARSCL